MRILHCTASTLRAMLCYVESGKTVPIAYDRDDLAAPLAQKLKATLGDKAGSQPVTIHFAEDERELERQFSGCAYRIGRVFADIAGGFTP